MYQDLAPVNSLVVSNLDPVDYYHSVTTEPAKFIRFPGMRFVNLGNGALAADLPYSFMSYLRTAW